MSVSLHSPCANLEVAGYDVQGAAEATWQAMVDAGVFIEGDFTFASGMTATLKADAERLYDHPEQLEVVLGCFAAFPCVQAADTLLYVPNGMKKFVTLLGSQLDKPVVAMERDPASTSKYDFVFASPADEEVALAAQRPVIGEDIVTTLGSVAGVRALLDPTQKVHSLAMLLRGSVHLQYRTGLTDHYLVERQIPADKYEFRRRLEEGWA